MRSDAAWRRCDPLTEARQQADAVAAAAPPADTGSEVDKVGHRLNLETSLTLCGSIKAANDGLALGRNHVG